MRAGAAVWRFAERSQSRGLDDWLGPLVRIEKGPGAEKTKTTAAGLVGGGGFEKTRPICGTKPIWGTSDGFGKTDPRARAGSAVKREKLGEDRAKAGVIFGVY